MPRASRIVALSAAAVLTLGLAACATSPASDDTASGDNGDFTPITIEHAFGETVIDAKPERVATVAWANQEVPLALGVVPVGMAKVTWGDDDEDGLLPWVKEKLDELDAETPVLFDETDGIDFEGVADTNPDVILAAYSGLTQEDYDTLSEIAPVVAYPENAWGTSWRDTITQNAAGMGLVSEGDDLVAELEQEISDAAAEHPSLEGKSVMFLTHVDESDLSEVSFYTTHDTRTMFFDDLGMQSAPSIITASEATDQYSLTQSAEQADAFNDVDVIVTYGGDDLVATLEGDPLLSQIPAVANKSIVNLSGSGPMGTAANPTALSISHVVGDYAALLAAAADNAE
jgi:iron complex transport system substrate-binding protein